MKWLYLPRDFYNRLNELAKQHNATLFYLLLGALYVYFTRIAGRDDFAIGLPVLNRANVQFKQTAGLFTGVSLTLFDFDRELTFAQLLQKINKTLKTNYRHQRFPVSEINPAVGLGTQRSQLFDVNLSYENHDYDAHFDGVDSYFTAMLHPWEQTPLMIFVRDFHQQASIKFDFVFNFAYFKTEDIKALQARFVTILEAVLKDSLSPIHTLPVMTEKEKNQLIAWNDTATDYPMDKSIVDLFEEQVDKRPSNIAVVFEQQQLSYSDLNEQANKLAHYLSELKNKTQMPDNPLFAIAVDRSLDMVIGLLGIEKAGGAYVPIDPSYPAVRIQYMLEDSRTGVLLTQSHLKAQLPVLEHDCVIVCLDDFDFEKKPLSNPTIKPFSTDLAYVIYTSGSTRMPKGVMIEQRNLLNSTQARINYYLNHQIKFLLPTSFAFDSSVAGIFSSLLMGGELYISHETNDLSELSKLIWQHGISHLLCVPALYAALLELSHETLQTLHTVIVAGESGHADLIQQHETKMPQTRLFNEYGPTEGTVWSTVYQYQPSDYLINNIGQAIANTRIYILDREHQIQPSGIPGELCIAGHGLARGYLNRPELTAEKFIEVELLGKTERIYKTGDLARLLPDGNLEYLGRIDHQVKLRGFRIELGEIEAWLRQHEAVSDAVVILYEADENKRLVAYITTDSVANDLVTVVKDWLKARLPDYMVPSQFMVLDKLPLTHNGKIDRQALPAPEANVLGENSLPRDALELQLLRVWETVLDVHPLSIHDNFFELGGHSLLAVKLMSHIQQQCGVRLPVSVLFQNPTIATLAGQLRQNTTSRLNNLLPIQTVG